MAERFHYDYSDAELDEIFARAERLAAASDTVHVVFNNNSRDFAPRAAERLRRRLGQPPSIPAAANPTAAPTPVPASKPAASKPAGRLVQGTLF